MKALQFITPTCLFIEIGQSSLKALDGDAGLELPLERQENGRLSAPCRERLALSLRSFLKANSWLPRRRAFCAIGARGVTLRRLALPTATEEEFQRLLVLQIESEFPLPPDQLAWGYSQITGERGPQTGPAAGRELIVGAVKKEVIEEYSEILSGTGLNPVFTLGALARSSVCPRAFPACAVLDIGCAHSELITFEGTFPSALRILPWGGDDLTRSIAKSLGMSHDEAERIKTNLDQASISDGELGQKIQSGILAEMESLAGLIKKNWIGQKLYLTGKSSRLKELAPWLARTLGGGIQCERMEVMPGEGRSAAVLGLKRIWESDGDLKPLIIDVKKTRSGDGRARPAPGKWVALAVLLALSSFSLRYAEPVLQKARLSRKLSEIKAYRERLPQIDRELSFLQFLKNNQPPYLDALHILANAAAPGTRLESLSMNRQGDLSLRGTMQNAQQATDLRTKLIESGLFSSVVVDEQTPTSDREKIIVRITAHWKPASEREFIPVHTAPSQEPERSKPQGKEPKSNAPGKLDASPPASPRAVRSPRPVHARARSTESHFFGIDEKQVFSATTELVNQVYRATKG